MPGSAAVLTDYMPLGTLETFVLSPAAPPPGSPAWLRQGVSLLLDVAHAMAHLHAEGFVWRDCAARNVLLCHEGGHDRLLRGKYVACEWAVRGSGGRQWQGRALCVLTHPRPISPGQDHRLWLRATDGR